MSASLASGSSSTTALAQGTCEPCKANSGIQPLSKADADALLAELNSPASPSADGGEQSSDAGKWTITPRPPPHDSIPALERTFLFRNFKHAIAFTNAVGDVAEREGHHPALLTEWGSVKVAWWTHVIGGLHRNDFVMAAKTSELFADAPGKKKVQP
ncbi:hypothetical protein V8E36_005071 [Tilletia maclaganii]